MPGFGETIEPDPSEPVEIPPDVNTALTGFGEQADFGPAPVSVAEVIAETPPEVIAE